MYACFGQELYAKETIAAAALLTAHVEGMDTRRLTAHIADILPQPSPTTRLRVATKILQRLCIVCEPPAPASGQEWAYSPPDEKTEDLTAPKSLRDAEAHRRMISFARLLSALPDTQARHELVYHATARVDTLIDAIACEILYPYFVDERIPAPYTEDEFIMANAGLLLAPEPILTTGFVTDYARRAWNFTSERTLCLCLRILRQAGILFSAPLLGERGRVHAYTLAPHSLRLPTLLWGLFEEFGREGVAPAWDQVCRSRLAQRFVVAPSVIASQLWEAERAGLVGFWNVSGARRVALKVREADALACLLLTGQERAVKPPARKREPVGQGSLALLP